MSFVHLFSTLVGRLLSILSGNCLIYLCFSYRLSNLFQFWNQFLRWSFHSYCSDSYVTGSFRSVVLDLSKFGNVWISYSSSNSREVLIPLSWGSTLASLVLLAFWSKSSFSLRLYILDISMLTPETRRIEEVAPLFPHNNFSHSKHQSHICLITEHQTSVMF